MTEPMTSLKSLRNAYHRIKAALPWLDATAWPEQQPVFQATAHAVEHPCVTAAQAIDGRAALLRYDPAVHGPLDGMESLLRQLADAHMPLVVLHTDVSFEQLADLAQTHAALPIILESGPRKILYFIAQVEQIMLRHENIHLSTYNLCNWMGLERLCNAGLGNRLLFGSHGPMFSADAAMGPIVFGQFSWQQKCDLAGNNLRRLLGMDIIDVPEVPYRAPEPFIIDAHAHNVYPAKKNPSGFPVPDETMPPEGWATYMDHAAIAQLYLIWMDAIEYPDKTCQAGTAALRDALPGRLYYMEVFNSNGDADHRQRLEASLQDSQCLGLKFHPTMHKVEADSDAYRPGYELAQQYNKPILTHSWEISDYNPYQYMSYPQRFSGHLAAHPEVKLVLGHAGGRPRALDAVAALCGEFPGVSVDLAGDYYDNGLIETLVQRLGVERILFASDVDWIDPRCNMAPVLASGLSDADVLKILRTNALPVWGVDTA